METPYRKTCNTDHCFTHTTRLQRVQAYVTENAGLCLAAITLVGVTIIFAALLACHEPNLGPDQVNAHAVVSGIYAGGALVVGFVVSGTAEKPETRLTSVVVAAHGLLLTMVSAVVCAVF